MRKNQHRIQCMQTRPAQGMSPCHISCRTSYYNYLKMNWTSKHETRLAPRHYSPTASPPRMFSPPATRHPTPTPSQQATMDLGAVLLHLELNAVQSPSNARRNEESSSISGLGSARADVCNDGGHRGNAWSRGTSADLSEPGRRAPRVEFGVPDGHGCR